MIHNVTLEEACGILAKDVLKCANENGGVIMLPDSYEQQVSVETDGEYGTYGFAIMNHPFDDSEVVMGFGYIEGGAFHIGLIYPGIPEHELADEICALALKSMDDNDDRGKRNRSVVLTIRQ